MVYQRFCEILIEVAEYNKSKHYGIGVVLYSKLSPNSISPLSILEKDIHLPISNDHAIVDMLIKLTRSNHPNHDGFHFISNELSLTHISQYFSTPIVNNRSMQIYGGSRYRTAYYGSFLDGIIACGIASDNYKPTIFKQGIKYDPYIER
ncbi:MAG TPA: hypothetical protein VF974_02825 [Patescibacteria group bacterium]